MRGAGGRRLAAMIDRPHRSGHQLTLLKGGAALFPSMIEAISQARTEVLLESYIFEFEGTVLGVASALEAAAQRGVAVRVVVDGIGTGPLPALWSERWQAAGVQWHVYNPARGWRLLMPKGWRRLHRKLCVVDARIAFCGGVNLLDDYFDPYHGVLKEPRLDFAVRAAGPLVADVHDTMTRLWRRLQITREASQHDLDAAVVAVRDAARAGLDIGNVASRLDTLAPDAAAPDAPQPPGALAQLVLRDNVRFRRSIEGMYRMAIAQARHEVLIANAYFIPGVQLQRALLRAARRGVRITLLLQGRYEYFMHYHASRAVYGMLLDAGIEIVEYEASFLHAKVAVMDGPQGALSTVGSSNLDPLSLLLAREANVFVRDDAFAAELRAHLMEAMQTHGRRIDVAVHTRRPRTARLLNWIAYGLMRIALLVTRHRY